MASMSLRCARRWLVATVAAILLGGCGWLSDDRGLFVERRDDYLEAEEGPEVVVPEDLNDAELADPFPIPPTPPQSDAEFYPFKPPLPDAIYGDEKRESVRIQRLGERRWLVIPEPPATVWPKIKQFFADNGVAIAAEQPRIGRIDSDWLPLEERGYRDIVRTVLLESRSKDGASEAPERLLIRVEQGIQDRTSEVHLRHQRSLARTAPAPDDIGALGSASTAAEQEMLSELGAFVAARVAEQTVSMVGQSISTQPKSVMERAQGGAPALRLNLDFDRAWATVGQALSNAEITVDNADEAQSTYDIKVSEATFTGERKGFFGRLFSFGSDEQSLKIQLKPAANAAADAAYWVQIADEAGSPADRELAQELLVLLREYAG